MLLKTLGINLYSTVQKGNKKPKQYLKQTSWVCCSIRDYQETPTLQTAMTMHVTSKYLQIPAQLLTANGYLKLSKKPQELIKMFLPFLQ